MARWFFHFQILTLRWRSLHFLQWFRSHWPRCSWWWHQVFGPSHPSIVITSSIASTWMFPKIVVPQNGWFIMENLIKMDDLGVNPIFGNTHLRLWREFFTPEFELHYLRRNFGDLFFEENQKKTEWHRGDWDITTSHTPFSLFVEAAPRSNERLEPQDLNWTKPPFLDSMLIFQGASYF